MFPSQRQKPAAQQQQQDKYNLPESFYQKRQKPSIDYGSNVAPKRNQVNQETYN
jgi:hypothetical protein